MSAVRVALIGGLLSFRGLFGWLHPALFVPTLIVPPLFQVLFFAYLGRAAELESDTFYVVGNSIQLAALPGLFAMSQAIAGERRAQTLAHLLASPASRLALFLGRGLPAMAIGVAVSLTSFAFGALMLDVEVSSGSLPLLVLTMATAAFSCTALGIAHAAIALRVRELAVFSNLVFALLLVFCGVNVPLDDAAGLDEHGRGRPAGDPRGRRTRGRRGAAFADVAGLLARSSRSAARSSSSAWPCCAVRVRRPPAGDARAHLSALRSSKYSKSLPRTCTATLRTGTGPSSAAKAPRCACPCRTRSGRWAPIGCASRELPRKAQIVQAHRRACPGSARSGAGRHGGGSLPPARARLDRLDLPRRLGVDLAQERLPKSGSSAPGKPPTKPFAPTIPSSSPPTSCTAYPRWSTWIPASSSTEISSSHLFAWKSWLPRTA